MPTLCLNIKVVGQKLMNRQVREAASQNPATIGTELAPALWRSPRGPQLDRLSIPGRQQRPVAS
ncbi:MAG: hypothetical protein AAFY11_10775 [Cyanobacteria bacterium J06641_5]